MGFVAATRYGKLPTVIRGYRAARPGEVSPIIMSSRKGDRSPEIKLVLRLIRQMYRREGIV